MEATIGGESQMYYTTANQGDLRSVGNGSLEWDPNHWKWDGDLFLATRLPPNPPPNYQSRQFFPINTGIPPPAGTSSNSSSSCSDEPHLVETEKEKRDLEKRRRAILVEDDEHHLEDKTVVGSSLSLKLGGQELGNWDGPSGKKTKFTGPTATRAVCQVENCRADLSKAKDYHRRHKVCEMHSKACKALVNNVMQRFCQQCSRFHALQEFDEGKRSCRRRLAGHNKRRRKSQPDPVVNNSSLSDNQASGYLLMSLLKILSNMHSNRINNTDDPDLLSHILRSLADQNVTQGDTNMSGLLLESQKLLDSRTCFQKSEAVSTLLSNGPAEQHHSIPVAEIPSTTVPHMHELGVENLRAAASQQPGAVFPIQGTSLPYVGGRSNSTEKTRLNNFDLNDVYVDSDDGTEDVDRLPIPVDLGTASLECPLWIRQDSHQSSPPQTSGNSDSASTQSPSSSSGDTQSRTDRIVFKLFGKEPSDFPFVLRAQILDWLSHSPTDIESYIRPGCIILTIYLRLSETAWEELCRNLSSSLSRLLNVSGDDTFWRSGWSFVRLQKQIVFAYNGRVVVDTSLPFKTNLYPTILNVKPIAVPVSEKAQFTIEGTNLSYPTTRLLCALEGRYLSLEAGNMLVARDSSLKKHDSLQSLNFSCTLPAVAGRGFIEVDEDEGLNSSFFPFIVADKDVCTEICMLENDIELSEKDHFQGLAMKTEIRNRALEFVHEMGWLLHRDHLKSRLNDLDPNSNIFPFKRFKWLMEFSVDHNWCAVVKKLLNILFGGTVGAAEHPFLKFVLHEMGLLHRAVRRNSRPLVELLLRYVPEFVADELNSEYESLVGDGGNFLFRPDVVGPAGLTPLHVAAGRDGSEDVLDALTNDPGKVGIEAWKNARDSTGFTPEDYARLRGHYSYIHLVQRKMNKNMLTGHVAVNIPTNLLEGNSNQKQNEGASSSFEIAAVQLRVNRQSCQVCNKKLIYGSGNRSLLYRPAMLSMVAIAAVCVCVALLFKSSPEVLYVFRPFRWEMLDYGSS